MAKKSFTELTKDLENLSEEEQEDKVTKSDTSEEEELVTPKKEDNPSVEGVKVVQPEANTEEEAEEKEEAISKTEDDADEEVEKSDNEPEEKEETDPDSKEKDSKSKGKKETKAGEKKSNDKDNAVKKSEESEDEITGEEMLKAFQSVVNSYESIQKSTSAERTSLKAEITSMKEDLAEATKLIKSLIEKDAPVEEEVAKSTEEEVTEEEVSKSTEEDTEPKTEVTVPEDKATDFISKSEDGESAVPTAQDDGVTDEEGEDAPFNAKEHVDTVTDYFLKHGKSFSREDQYGFRASVNRVNRGQGNDNDIELFKEVVAKSKE